MLLEQEYFQNKKLINDIFSSISKVSRVCLKYFEVDISYIMKGNLTEMQQKK